MRFSRNRFDWEFYLEEIIDFTDGLKCFRPNVFVGTKKGTLSRRGPLGGHTISALG